VSLVTGVLISAAIGDVSRSEPARVPSVSQIRWGNFIVLFFRAALDA
jgi:hypothetical protein